MARVYIETTIPSYYFESRRSTSVVAWRAATRRWWGRHRPAYDLVTSDVVLRELAQAPEPKASQMLRLLASIPRLEPSPQLADVAAYYVEHLLMPRTAEADAFHVAIASLAGVDFLLTWNCKHLANANKTRHLAVLNARLGLSVPIITTPFSLIPETPDAPPTTPND